MITYDHIWHRARTPVNGYLRAADAALAVEGGRRRELEVAHWFAHGRPPLREKLSPRARDAPEVRDANGAVHPPCRARGGRRSSNERARDNAPGRGLAELRAARLRRACGGLAGTQEASAAASSRASAGRLHGSPRSTVNRPGATSWSALGRVPTPLPV
jgi:hypothetical protein